MRSYARSAAMWEQACRTAPGGIHSNVRKGWRPHPLFYVRGAGSRVWDADDNESIDYVLARGPLLLGHSPGPVLEAVRRQLETGLMYAGQHPLELAAAELFCALVPCAEMVRFATSGSEAVHAAVRLARAVTGRTKLLRFEGHYHGWFDGIAWNYAPPLDRAGAPDAPVPIPGSRGQPASDGEHLVICPWNDLALAEAALARHRGEIAAILTEPMMCNTGGVLPRPGYLEGLRALATQHGALLIFDEVITGFRLSVGGAQARFGVIPDLAVFAKGMAAGFPVSAIAGRAAHMAAFGDLSVTHAGTYNSNAPCMAASLAAMETIAADEGAALRRVEALGGRLMEGIAEAGRRAGRRVQIRGVGVVFHVSFNHDEEITDYRSFTKRDAAAYARFALALQERGVRVIPEGLWFLSTAHTDADADQTLAAVAEAMEAV